MTKRLLYLSHDLPFLFYVLPPQLSVWKFHTKCMEHWKQGYLSLSAKGYGYFYRRAQQQAFLTFLLLCFAETEFQSSVAKKVGINFSTQAPLMT